MHRGDLDTEYSRNFETLDKTIDYYSKSHKADNSFMPDLIVINHGTNDFAADYETFKKGYTDAIAKIHAIFPNADIYVMIPFNQEHVAAIREVAQENGHVTLIETEGWGITYTDGVHPNVQGAKRGGEKLADYLRENLGDEFFK